MKDARRNYGTGQGSGRTMAEEAGDKGMSLWGTRAFVTGASGLWKYARFNLKLKLRFLITTDGEIYHKTRAAQQRQTITEMKTTERNQKK